MANFLPYKSIDLAKTKQPKAQPTLNKDTIKPVL